MAFVALLVLAGATAAAARPSMIGAGQSRAATPLSTSLNPTLFSELSTGVVLIRGFSCTGSGKIEGTGFLVGSGVVMTARHVVDPSGKARQWACRVKVKLDGHWAPVEGITWWYRAADPTGRDTDLATLKLGSPASAGDHLFGFRNSSPPIGTNLAVLGHPLGNQISLNQGTLVEKGHFPSHHVPQLAIHMLSAEGGSGSPIVDNQGSVVGVFQQEPIVASGDTTSDTALGVDLASWWGSGRRVTLTLCHAYPKGGIANCPGSGRTSPPPPPPPPVPAAKVSLTVLPTSIQSGQAATLQLASDATRCDPTPWNPGPAPVTNGEFSTGALTITSTFAITCYNSDGVSTTATAVVTVTAAPPPPPPPPPSPKSATYNDATGETPGEADIGTIVVSSDPVGKTVSFDVQILNMPTWEAGAQIDISIDADRNLSTGVSGYEYDLDAIPQGWAFRKWDGTQYQVVSGLSFTVTYNNGHLVATGIPLSAFEGLSGSFGFVVITARGATRVLDTAPDTYPGYTFTL
jgi:Trypsin-like peptidase domain